jgi:hypothetical protein
METALNYLGVLLNDIEQLKNNLAQYNNLILMLEAKYGVDLTVNKLSKTMGEQERVAVINTVGLFRTYATRTYIGYSSIKKSFINLDPETEEQIEKHYKVISRTAVPNYDEAETFVQILSNLFVNEINVQALINQSQKTESLAQASVSPNFEGE